MEKGKKTSNTRNEKSPLSICKAIKKRTFSFCEEDENRFTKAISTLEGLKKIATSEDFTEKRDVFITNLCILSGKKRDFSRFIMSVWLRFPKRINLERTFHFEETEIKFIQDCFEFFCSNLFSIQICPFDNKIIDEIRNIKVLHIFPNVSIKYHKDIISGLFVDFYRLCKYTDYCDNVYPPSKVQQKECMRELFLFCRNFILDQKNYSCDISNAIFLKTILNVIKSDITRKGCLSSPENYINLKIFCDYIFGCFFKKMKKEVDILEGEFTDHNKFRESVGLCLDKFAVAISLIKGSCGADVNQDDLCCMFSAIDVAFRDSSNLCFSKICLESETKEIVEFETKEIIQSETKEKE